MRLRWEFSSEMVPDIGQALELGPIFGRRVFSRIGEESMGRERTKERRNHKIYTVEEEANRQEIGAGPRECW